MGILCQMLLYDGVYQFYIEQLKILLENNEQDVGDGQHTQNI